MNKLALFLFLIITATFNIYGQMGKTLFPYISFFDGYVNYKIPPHNWGTPFNSDSLALRAKELSVLMDSLGITHSVSWADSISTIPSDFNRQRKILDMHLEWCKDMPEILGVETGKYLKAQGQDKNRYPFQIGGNSAFSLSPINNFGFGNESSSSVWFMNLHPDLIPAWVGTNVTGRDTILLLYSGELNVRKAVPSLKEEDVKSYVVYGKVNRIHFTNTGEQHYISIRTMTEPSTLHDSTEVFRVRLKIVPTSGYTASKDFYDTQQTDTFTVNNNGKIKNPLVKTIEMIVRKGDLSSTNMEWITLTDPTFHFREYGAVSVDKIIEVGILYGNKVTTYIDAITFHDSLYEAFFNDPELRSNIKSQLNAKKAAVGGNPLFESFYFDEPYTLTANVRKSYTKFIREKMPSGKSFDLSGASGNYWRWHFRFDRFHAKNDVTNFYKNTLIFNHYPFSIKLKRGYEPGGQAEIQAALNNLIEYKGEKVLPFTGNEDPDQFMGLVTAIDAAQNFGPELEEDIPLIQTVQVSGIRGFNPATPTYVTSPFGSRVPSPQEIVVQANLGISFGAKGFMFYMIPTRIDQWGMATYGVFDDKYNPYNESSSAVAKSRADNPQVPNPRYWALKDYIKSLKPIENWILRSTWVGAYSGDTQTYRRNAREDWIDAVYTRIDSTDESFENISYTETGMFHLTKFDNPNSIEPDTLFLYITNKLVDVSALDSSASTRFIRVYLNNPGLSYANYSVIDMNEIDQPIIASLSKGMPDSICYFDTKITGGGGKLIMITARFHTGKVMEEDEVIEKTIPRVH
ncbi:MAG: hypothetical protein IPJ75_09240 [Ignavibacteriales bacterium]|nr:hypothetical protein [Ignavibacteriales bacterium]